MRQYSLHDIQRYLEAKLPAIDMHAMEKAALKDPFLADAIDGYALAGMQYCFEDLADIETHLTQQQTTVENARHTSIGSYWAWMAASVVLVLGSTAAWIFFSHHAATTSLPATTITSNITKEIQANKQPVATIPVQEKSSIARKKENDRMVLHNDPYLSDTILAANATPLIKGYDTTIKHREIVYLPVKLVPAPKSADSTKVDARTFFGDDTALNTACMIPNQQIEILLSGDKTLNDKKRVSAAGQSTGNFDKQSGNDAIGANKRFFVDRPTDPIIGRAIKPATAKPIPLKSVLPSLKVIPMNVESSTALVPAGGWENFSSYLTQKLNMEGYAIGSMKKDSCVVDIYLTKQGKVTRTRIVKQKSDMIHAYDESFVHAIDKAFTEGPAWMRIPAKEGFVRILLYR